MSEESNKIKAANTLSWTDTYNEGKFIDSTLWLLPDKFAIMISGCSIYAKSGGLTLVCPVLSIFHSQMKSTTVDDAKAEAIEMVKVALRTYGNALRAYMKQENIN